MAKPQGFGVFLQGEVRETEDGIRLILDRQHRPH